MSGIRFSADARWSCGAVLGLVLLCGCSDSRRETGTQVQETEEMKKQTEDMRAMYSEMEKSGGRENYQP